MRCTEDSLRVGESLAGTATASNFWLVVEQPGPYAGREAALSSGIAPDLGERLLAAVGARGGKLLLVRAPGRHPSAHPASRRIWWCQITHPAPEVWTATVTDPAELLEWAALDDVRHVATAAQRVADPLLLVCTHGRRDACCARSGRGLLADIQHSQGEVWESSHQGGHRFAPVVLELTTGYQHGRVTSSDLAAIARAASQGRVYLPTARGHVGLNPALQAADLAVRQETGITDLPGVQLNETDGVIHAAVRSGPRFVARVQHHDLPSRIESCGGSPGPATNLSVDLQPD